MHVLSLQVKIAASAEDAAGAGQDQGKHGAEKPLRLRLRRRHEVVDALFRARAAAGEDELLEEGQLRATTTTAPVGRNSSDVGGFGRRGMHRGRMMRAWRSISSPSAPAPPSDSFSTYVNGSGADHA